MPQPRKAERVRSLLSARIVYNKNASSIDCVVKNISSAGVRLEIGDGTALPAEFDLNIPHKSRTYRARVVWRGEGMVGAEFVDPQTGAAVESVTKGDETDADRADRLMIENARLRAKVLELKQRIAQLSGEA